MICTLAILCKDDELRDGDKANEWHGGSSSRKKDLNKFFMKISGK